MSSNTAAAALTFETVATPRARVYVKHFPVGEEDAQRANSLDNSLCDFLRICRGNSGENNQEGIVRPPPDGIVRADSFLDGVPDGLKDLVSRQVSVLAIDFTKMSQIQHDDAERTGKAAGTF